MSSSFNFDDPPPSGGTPADDPSRRFDLPGDVPTGQPVSVQWTPGRADPRMIQAAQIGSQQMLGRIQKRGPFHLGCFWWVFIIGMTIVFPIVLIAFLSGAFNSMSGTFDDLLGEGNLLSQFTNATAGVLPESRPIPPETTAAAFDPVIVLAGLRSWAGDNALLGEIFASQVRQDGTLDLTATYTPAPYVEYTFYRQVERPADAPPVGAGGSNTGPWYEPIEIRAYRPGQTSTITSTGGGVSVRAQFMNQGFALERDDPEANAFNSDESLLDPRCPFSDLWAQAIARGAPADAVASIRYTADGYEFNITGVFNLDFDRECKPE